jgi:hypothetical protein
MTMQKSTLSMMLTAGKRETDTVLRLAGEKARAASKQ